jgi:hypothetical protein
MFFPNANAYLIGYPTTKTHFQNPNACLIGYPTTKTFFPNANAYLIGYPTTKFIISTMSSAQLYDVISRIYVSCPKVTFSVMRIN